MSVVQKVPLFIGGKFVASASGKTFANLNPATGEQIAEIAEASAEDVDRAARAARQAFEVGPWPGMTAAERSRVLRRIADVMDAHKEELARIESIDTGKPIREAVNGDIPRAISYFRIFADYLTTQSTECFPMDGQGLNYVLREPIGVAGLITPWNFPLMILCSKVAPALAAGNTVVAKPAEWTPMTAARFAELMAEAGLPEGAFNLVHGFGPSAAGEAMTTHPAVNAISFTGETSTGQAIMAAASKTLKRLSFELGGKGATLVFADADFEEAVGIAAMAAFRNQGQVCTAGSRILVEESIYEKFLIAIVARAKAIKIGDPLDPQTEMGSLVHAEHRARVQSYLDFAHSTGVNILCGGKAVANMLSPNFLEATVIAEPNANARLCQEEIFGPVVTVTPFKSEDEAVAFANGTKYGLASTICTGNVSRAHRVASRLITGTVWINTWSIRDPRVPFGGYKSSGLGREGGLHSLDFFSESKTVLLENMNAIIIALLLTFQQPVSELDAVVQRATAYVTKYQADFGNLIGTEDYLQTWSSDRFRMKSQRRTSSDVLILQVGSEWAALRKVNIVDGSKVKKKVNAFDESFAESAEDNSKRLIQLKVESTEYNIGDIGRSINSPTFALNVLRESDVWRFNFEHTRMEKIDGVSTWVIQFTERGTQTLVRGEHGELLHSTGTLWIEPATGRVLKTEFLVENPWGNQPVKAKTLVSYSKGKTLDMLVPHEMVEHYETAGSTIDCVANYSMFHRFEVNVKFDFGPAKPR